MWRWQEVKEDDPFMASERELAQSKFMCTTQEESVKCVNMLVTLYLLYLLFQENKSFGAITICIHPLMYKKPCQEESLLCCGNRSNIGVDVKNSTKHIYKFKDNAKF
jgi:hypothetical protein